MFTNNSPWIKQLNRTRPIATIEKLDTADIAIIGGGIAGVTTAYYILKNTQKKVALFEAGKVAHGATGHNAGQVVAYFERPFADIVREFGLEMTARGIGGVENAWTLLEQIVHDAGLRTPLSSFMSPHGYTHMDQVMIKLEELRLRKEGGLPVYPVLIANSIPKSTIPERYYEFVEFTNHANILSLLESKDGAYIALSQDRAGCMNSALFTEELVGYLLATYKDRFFLSEHTPVHELVLTTHGAVVKIQKGNIRVDRVILCTNGFEYIKIKNLTGPNIDSKFHHEVRGYIGYMAAYTDTLNRAPNAITYYNTPSTNPDDPYFYLTRRPYDLDGAHPGTNLVSVGGPGRFLADMSYYSSKDLYPTQIVHSIKSFVNKTYDHAPTHTHYEFTWHGLMGFTRNYLRLIGEEPCNKVLIYNLGCNGVGILTSIYGGYRIGELLRGAPLEPSIFDPQDRTCHL